jgi:predicted ATPase/class 3 adenylate cyclase
MSDSPIQSPVPSATAVPARRPLPTGTVTFLFTDIEGSTRLLQELGDGYSQVLSDHRAVLDEAIGRNGGSVIGTEGDAVFSAFPDAPSAVTAAVEAQRALAAHEWPGGGAIKVRMGVHAGVVTLVGSDYVGLTLHQVARITAAGHGGQVVLSDAARALAGAGLPAGVELRDLGEHRLRDLTQPERLYQAVIPGLPSSFPPLRTLDARPNNLPVQPTTFVGRNEIETARRLLAGTRLLTLTGPGGTGKTRLALQLAAELLDEFRDGVFFVALDTVTDPSLVPSTIDHALGVEVGNSPPLDRLIEHFRDRQTLLVLDNFEQVVAAGPAIAHLMREAAGLKVLATSRTQLRIYGEQEFSVPPLGLPRTGARIRADEAMDSEAVRLFVERGLAANPAFQLTDENATAVAEIVTRLDGLPLAIELAAARLRILPVETLRTRLDKRLAILTGGPRDLPARQQTLRGAIDWSHDLLDQPDRRLFERFAVFSGGACLSQAEGVCGPASEVGREILDGLASLAEQSLVRGVPPSESEPRFAMLATIREYAIEQMDTAGEANMLRRRHAETYLAIAEGAGGYLTGKEAGRWLDRLALDHDNLRAAFDWSIEEARAEIALRLVSALWRFWQIRGHLFEATERAARALRMDGVSELPPLIRSRALGAAGSIAYWRGDIPVTHAHYAAALAAARESEDRRALAEALYNFGFAPVPDATDGTTIYTAGRPYLEEALALYRELGDERGIAGALWALAIAEGVMNQFDAARAHFEESLALSRKLGDEFGVGWANHMLGAFEVNLGRPDLALPFLSEALETFSRSHDLSGILILLLDFALQANAKGETERGWRLAGAASALQASTGLDLVNVPIGEWSWEIPKLPEDDPAAVQAWRAGQEMSVDDAVALALGGTPLGAGASTP